jgi:hypothetical protein
LVLAAMIASRSETHPVVDVFVDRGAHDDAGDRAGAPRHGDGGGADDGGDGEERNERLDAHSNPPGGRIDNTSVVRP